MLLDIKSVSKKIGKSLIDINESMEQLVEVSKAYKSISMRAARFFFVSVDLIKLNSMYLFTREWFFSFFTKLLTKYSETIAHNEQMSKPERIKQL